MLLLPTSECRIDPSGAYPTMILLQMVALQAGSQGQP